MLECLHVLSRQPFVGGLVYGRVCILVGAPMMKIKSFFAAVVLGSVVLGSPLVCGVVRAEAGLFGAQVLGDSRVVAIAVPVDNGAAYNLLVVEQLGNSRACWREEAGSPTVIDPLLLGFDFTNVCNRSTDSNGYSVRLAGEDMAWRYGLRLVVEGNDVVLKAFNEENSWRSPLEVGRTNGIVPGMLKINLDAGWQMAKRTYQGQTLGHIYMVNDQTTTQLLATRGEERPRSMTLTAPAVTTPSSSQTAIATAPKTTTPGAIQIFVPPSNPATNLSTPISSTVQADNLGIAPLPVPNKPIPVGVNGTLPPAPLSVSLARSLGLNYKVIVDATTETQKTMLKQIVPDAFNTWVDSRRVMQAGAFADEGEAQELQQRLTQAGLPSRIVMAR